MPISLASAIGTINPQGLPLHSDPSGLCPWDYRPASVLVKTAPALGCMRPSADSNPISQYDNEAI